MRRAEQERLELEEARVKAEEARRLAEQAANLEKEERDRKVHVMHMNINVACCLLFLCILAYKIVMRNNYCISWF